MMAFGSIQRIVLWFLVAFIGQRSCVLSHANTDTRECAQKDNAATHLIVLVHGYMGSDKELGYLQEALEREASMTELSISIFSSKANVGKTSDGIANGGRRLAGEIKNKIQGLVKEKALANNNLTLSIVGNSLGGLYSRYALGEMNLDELQVEPFIFCTTSTPHLGNTQNTFLKFPSWAEWWIGKAMQETGADLFHLTPTIPEMCLGSNFLSPLGRFKKRIALANAYGTDFLVPVSTAAFLTNSSSAHRTVQNSTANRYIQHSILEVVTEEGKREGGSSMAESLDALGWTKIFVDIRDIMPPLFKLSSEFERKDAYSSDELGKLFEWLGSLAPFGHPIMVANSRSDLYRWMTAKGQPIMDDLANRLVQEIALLQ